MASMGPGRTRYLQAAKLNWTLQTSQQPLQRQLGRGRALAGASHRLEWAGGHH